MKSGMLAVVSRVVLAASLVVVVRAQSGPPTFEPAKPPTFRLRVSQVDTLLQAFEQQRIHALLEDYGLIERIAEVVAGAGADARRELEIRTEVARRGIVPDVNQLWSMIRSGQDLTLGVLGDEGLRQVEMQMRLSRDDDGYFDSSQIVIKSCTPRATGRWAKRFQDEVAWWRDCGWFEAFDGFKLSGMPMSVFGIGDRDGAEALTNAEQAARWFVELPGAYVIGQGPRDELATIGEVDLAPPALAPGLHYEVSEAAWSDDVAGQPTSLERLLTAGLDGIRLDVQLEGDLVREQLEFVLGGDGDQPGLVDVLLGGSGPLAAQALPDGAMLQLRANLSIPKLLEVFAQVVHLTDVGEAVVKVLPDLLDGGLTLGVCAPAPGGVIPRVYVTLGVRDLDGLRNLLADLREKGMPGKQVTYEEVECTILEIPDVPQGLQPTWCIFDGRLHVAESPLSMRAYLRAQQQGVETMQLDEPLVAADVPGTPLQTLELRFDPASAYRAFYDIWMPLLELTMAESGAAAKITRDDMPEPRDFAECARPLRVAFFRDGNRVGMHSIGVLGGPAMTTYCALVGQLMPRAGVFHSPLYTALASDQLRTAGEALARFEAREGRLPKDLAELFVAEQLDDRALCIPADAHADELELPGERKVRVSYRYYPVPAAVDVFGNVHEARLICIEPSWNRVMLDTNGMVQQMWNEVGRQPIESFVPAAK